jgi:hypothetical protein
MLAQGYIGISKNVSSRFEQHRNRSQNPHLTNSINKYGWDNLTKQILLVGSNQYCLDIEKKLRPIKNIGWNLTVGGGQPPVAYGNKNRLGIPSWNKGAICSEDTKEKLRKSHLGQVAWNKGLKNSQVAWNKGIKGMIPGPRKGVILSQAIRDKISASKMGTKPTQKQREKISKANLGRKHSIIICPHCQKSGGSTAMPRWHFDNCKLKDTLL